MSELEYWISLHRTYKAMFELSGLECHHVLMMRASLEITRLELKATLRLVA